ncbi:MAG: sulfatase, partial [Verrucomicrobia bacterium]|nr:sulfatase [Verrucomicrobiota bacterium]
TKEFVFSMRTRPPAGVQDKDFRWGLTAPPEALEMALFDLRKDPVERTNVAANSEYQGLSAIFRDKLQSIVLGDRTECDWTKEGRNFTRSIWGKGSDDKRLLIPRDLIPPIQP